jgi:hypothetical protein
VIIRGVFWTRARYFQKMGFTRSEPRKERRRLRGDFAQMLYGSRWISAYVLSLLVAVEWFWGFVYQAMPDQLWLPYLPWLFPWIYGYLAAVWLKAGLLALRGRSVLGEGCFSASRRETLMAGLTFFTIFLSPRVLRPGDPGVWPLWGLACLIGTMLLPYMVLDSQSPAQAWRSAYAAAQRRPLVVVLSLVVAALSYLGFMHFIGLAWGSLPGLLTWAMERRIGGELFSWPIVSVSAYVLQLLLTALCWMIPGVASLWIYWKSTEQEA